MAKQLDPRIAEILERYGEDPKDTKGTLWDCMGVLVVYHRAVERIAARAGITFEEPTILRAERDEAVILVRARMGDRWDYDIGEAVVNVNYRVSGKQAAYVYAMALKRGRDRLVLKLVGLHGLVYSEEEADEFKPRAPDDAEPASITFSSGIKRDKVAFSFDDEIKAKIDAATTVDAVSDIMLNPEAQKVLAEMAYDRRDELRAYAKARLVALGWPLKAEK